MNRLSNDTLGTLPASVIRPVYDRRAVARGVVHFGPGAFHRAHQAAAFDTLLATDPRWGITGVSLNSTAVADALGPQDGLYTLALLSAETEFRVIGSILEVLTGAQRPEILAALAAPATRIITTTVTEKGYCLGGDGMLDFAHPAIAGDLAASAAPRSIIGWLALGLAERRRAGHSGVTVVSCDNVTDNGGKLGRAVRAFAAATDPDTAKWIEDEVRFPNTMVDSITPATDDALRSRVFAKLQLIDAWPIQRERFTQWVIEDAFAAERPELERAGATFTRDVHGFETAKLRLLNGAHSTLAYVGLGLGYTSVAQAMRDSRLAGFIERMMREDIAPSLSPPAGLDLEGYVSSILSRFANPAIKHRLSQIAWDGSQKLPYRILGTIRDAMAAGRPIDRLAVPIAAWLRFIDAVRRDKAELVDPLADRLLKSGNDWRSILAIPEIFGDLARDEQFIAAVINAARSAPILGSC